MPAGWESVTARHALYWRLYRHCQEDPDRRQKQHTHLGMQSEQMHARVDVDAIVVRELFDLMTALVAAAAP